MSPRKPRRRQESDTSPRPPTDAEAPGGEDILSVSVGQERDRLEVQTQPGGAVSQARCLVVASRAYRRRLCRGLRGAQLIAEPLDRGDLDELPPAAGGPTVVLVETSVSDAPPVSAAADGVIAVALLDETSADAHITALHAGWDAVVDRTAPVSVIVEVVWEAVHGRILFRSDVARQLAAPPPRSSFVLGGQAFPRLPEPSLAPATPAPTTPEHVAHEAIDRKRLDRATSGDGLGEPRTALAPVPATDAWQQMFDDAWVLWQPGIGACVLCRGGAIATRYAELGGPLGYLGVPVGDETQVGPGAYCRFALPGGAIVWHPKYGVHETHGAIGEYWLDTLGGPEGPWGFPISDEYDSGGGIRAVDFEGGTLVRREDRGIGELPRQQEFEVDRWLTLFHEPPRRAGSTGRAAVVGIREAGPGDDGGCTLFYTAATAGLIARVHDPAVVAVSRQIEHSRSLIGTVDPVAAPPVLLRTSVRPEEVLQVTGTSLPLGVTAEDLHRAELDLWRDIWDPGPDLPTLTASKGAKLTWAGFTADGHLEFLLMTLFARSHDARVLFLQAGIGIDDIDGRLILVVADTEQGWRLQGDDAERYIRCDQRLLSLFTAVLAGEVSAELLGGKPETAPARNEALRQATLDAQFLTVISHAGRLPGWTLLPPWTRELRAAVAHNLHLGCLTGWDVYEDTNGDPVEVVRAMVKDFFCGPAFLLAQSRVRFEGPAGHGALGDAAATFPPATDHDDPHARHIVAGGERRRVSP